jgi:arsenite methyltransferase
MSNIVFDDEMARIQRAIAESHDLVVRRNTFMETLNLRTGERALELGCGGGSYAFEAAQFVGSTGHISAVDISADQIAAARECCAGFAWVECQIGNLLELPHQDGEFDAVYSVQVLGSVKAAIGVPVLDPQALRRQQRLTLSSVDPALQRLVGCIQSPI